GGRGDASGESPVERGTTGRWAGRRRIPEPVGSDRCIGTAARVGLAIGVLEPGLAKGGQSPWIPPYHRRRAGCGPGAFRSVVTGTRGRGIREAGPCCEP